MTPTLIDAACHAATATRARHTSAIAAMRAQSRRPRTGSSRRSTDGFTNRTSRSGTIEKSSDTSTPMPTPWAAALQVTP